MCECVSIFVCSECNLLIIVIIIEICLLQCFVNNLSSNAKLCSESSHHRVALATRYNYYDGHSLLLPSLLQSLSFPQLLVCLSLSSLFE